MLDVRFSVKNVVNSSTDLEKFFTAKYWFYSSVCSFPNSTAVHFYISKLAHQHIK